MKLLLSIYSIIVFNCLSAQGSYKLAVLKYQGGGDWYANLETSLPNLIRFCNERLNMHIDPEQSIVEPLSPELTQYPFIHITGHGRITLNAEELARLGMYLKAGGFLHVSDNYGMDTYIRPILNKLIPGTSLVPIPANHAIFSAFYKFPKGLPKIHAHDNKAPEAWGLFYKGRLVCFYDVECDLGDGWENPEIHQDKPEVHQKALEFGANMLYYIFTDMNTP
jgi:hypothetical protein